MFTAGANTGQLQNYCQELQHLHKQPQLWTRHPLCTPALLECTTTQPAEQNAWDCERLHLMQLHSEPQPLCTALSQGPKGVKQGRWAMQPLWPLQCQLLKREGQGQRHLGGLLSREQPRFTHLTLCPMAPVPATLRLHSIFSHGTTRQDLTTECRACDG